MSATHVGRNSAREDQRFAAANSRAKPGVALLVCLALAGVAGSGLLRVRQVIVVGHNVPRPVLVRVAGVVGQNIFTVQADQVVRRLSQVHEVSVTRVESALPDRIVIYAQPRKPFLAWQRGTTVYLVDREGTVIKRVSGSPLPVVHGTNGGDSLGAGTVQAVNYAVRVLPRQSGGIIGEFGIDRKVGLTITGQTGWKALVGKGTPQALVMRIATLSSFLKATGNRLPHLKLVDLRYKVPYASFGG